MLYYKKKIIIGRREAVDFPDLNLTNITAKVDTGAYSTALHCHDIYEMREGKEKVLCFKVLDASFPDFNNKEACFKDYTRKKIKNSFGNYENRFVIKTKIVLGEKIIETYVSLTDRANMKYPVLIGRKLLSKGFIVDVTKTNLTKNNDH